MSLNITIARPYAKAAFAIALQTKALVAWTNLLQAAAQIVVNPQMKGFLQNPNVSPTDRLTLLCDVCAFYLNEERQNLFKLLALKHHLNVLPEIAKLFETYRVEHEKKAEVQVISAATLSAGEQQRLSDALELRLQRAVTLTCTVDATLLGGAIIKTGDWVIDDSIRSKLIRLETDLVN